MIERGSLFGSERVVQPMPQALVKRACPFGNVHRYLQHFIFVDFGDAGSEDDFVCEGDFDGWGACAGFVPRDAGPCERAKEEGDVVL